jgi:ribosomal protein L7/L12
MDYHKEAIDILEIHRGLRDQLIIQIAKDRPSAIVKAFKAIHVAPWVNNVKPLLPENKIQAIKLCKELTGMGLKEAKAAVEAIKL